MAWPLCPTFAKKPTDLNAGIYLSYPSPVVFSKHCIIVEDKRRCLKQHILEYNEDSTKLCTLSYVISLNSVLNHIVPFQALLPVYCISWYCYNCGTGHYQPLLRTGWMVLNNLFKNLYITASFVQCGFCPKTLLGLPGWSTKYHRALSEIHTS